MAKAKQEELKPEDELPADQQEPIAVESDGGALPTWNCRVDGTPADQQWTVGEVFYLLCDGPTTTFDSSELSFKEEEKTGYEIKVLEVTKQTNNSLEVRATSYIPAVHKFEKLMIYEGETAKAKVEPFQLPLKTIITDPQQKPYGPIAAMQMAYPMWIYIAVAAILVVGIFGGLFRMNRKAQMRKVIDELKAHNTALGAFNQFNKDLRTLGRQYIFGDKQGWSGSKKKSYIESLDGIFRMYLLREFYVPALDWSSNLVVKTIHKQDRKRYDRYGDDLQKFLKELDRAKTDVEKLQVHDCKQLTQMAKRVTQDIWKVRKV